MQTAAMLNVTMLSVNMLNVIMLSVAGVLAKASLQLAVIHFIRVGILKNVLRTSYEHCFENWYFVREIHQYSLIYLCIVNSLHCTNDLKTNLRSY